MVEITDSKSLEAWLESRPPEDAGLIAARAALRALSAFDGPLSAMPGVALPILLALRACAIANLAGCWPEKAAQIHDVASMASRAAERAASRYEGSSEKYYDQYQDHGYSINCALTAAAYAAYCAKQYSKAAIDAGDKAADGALAADRAVKAAGDSVWQAISWDASVLEEGTRHGGFNAMPLWSESTPELAGHKWHRLKDHLIAANEDWKVWTDWYDAILAGRPLDPDLELKKALIDDEAWQQGPTVVNAEIARLIAEHVNAIDATDVTVGRSTGTATGAGLAPTVSVDATAEPLPGTATAAGRAPTASVEVVTKSLPEPPPPRAAALHFVIREGSLRLAPPSMSSSPPGAEDGWSMLRDAASQMLGGRTAGNNALEAALQMVIRSLGSEFPAFNPLRLGLAGMTLQELGKRADEILLAEDAARLHAIVLQLQLLVAQYPEWRDYQAAIAQPMADPVTEQAAANLAADTAHEMIEAHPAAFDPEAAEAITEAAQLATPEPTPDDPEPIAPPDARRGWIRVFGEMVRSFALDVLAEKRKLAVKATAATGFAVLASVATKLSGLAQMLPAEYGWLTTVVNVLSSLVGA